MMEWASNRQENPMATFPTVKRERDKLPRAYVANCIYTLTGAAFQTWIDKQVKERNAKITREKDTIQMDP